MKPQIFNKMWDSMAYVSLRQWHEIRKWTPGRVWVSQKMASHDLPPAQRMRQRTSNWTTSFAMQPSAHARKAGVTFGSHWSQDWFASWGAEEYNIHSCFQLLVLKTLTTLSTPKEGPVGCKCFLYNPPHLVCFLSPCLGTSFYYLLYLP